MESSGALSDRFEKWPVWFPEWDNRPLILGALGLLLAIVLPIPSLVASLSVLIILFFRRSLWILGFALLGCWLRPPTVPVITRISQVEGEVMVESVAHRTVYSTTVFVSNQGYLLRLQLPPRASVAKGAVLSLKGEITPSPETYVLADAAKGVSGWLRPKGPVQTVDEAPWIFGVADILPRQFHEYTSRFSPSEGALIEALVTGNDGYIDPESRIVLRDGGVVHLIAASGLQVQTLALAVGLVLGRLPIPKSGQNGVIVLVLVIYTAIAGLSVAVTRAALMSLTKISAPYLRRQYEPLSALGFAAIVVLIGTPRSALLPGFYLSFGGMLALILVGGIAANLAAATRAALQCLAAGLITGPIAAIFFGGIATYGVISTALLSSIAASILALGLIGFAAYLSGFWIVASPTDFLLSALAAAFLGACGFITRAPGAYVTAIDWDPWPIALTVFLIALLWRPVPIAVDR